MTETDREKPPGGPQPAGTDPDEAADDAVIGVALRRSLLVVAVVALAGALLWWLSRPETAPAPVAERALEAPAPLPRWASGSAFHSRPSSRGIRRVYSSTPCSTHP